MNGRTSLLEGAQIVAFDPNTIDISHRIGFLHEDKAVALGRLIKADGQRDIIKVSKLPEGGKFAWKLHVGLHRTIGAMLEGLPVYGIVVSGHREELEDLEASENLHRRPLGPIERAKFVQALCQAAQERIARQHGELSQHQLGMKVRWERVKNAERRVEDALQEESDDTADKMSAVYGWQESAADALQLDKRTIRRSLELYRLIIEPFPELAEPLSRHPVVGENASQLRQIAQVKDETKRRAVIEALLEDDEIGAEDARITAGVDNPAGPTPPPYQKHWNAIEGGWARLGKGERTRFLRERLVPLLSPGERKALLEELSREIAS